MTYLEAAYRVLQEAGTALHYDEIARLALEKSYIAPKGSTPSATMGSRLYTDTKEIDSRFARAGRGQFTLKEQRRGDVAEQVAAIQAATRRQLRELLHDMPPDRFETLIYELLLEMGFAEDTLSVTPYSNDGGIDVAGVYRAAGLTEVNAAVQVKRWKHNVTRPKVTQLRGSLQVHQQGIIITTSDFSKGARAEAVEAGKTRIGLINGEELLDLLFKHQIGVTERPLTVVTLDDAWWAELIEAPEPSPEPDAPPKPKPTPRVESNYTGRKPVAYTLSGERHEVSSWRDLLIDLCTQLAQQRGEQFFKAVLPIRGSKRTDFSEQPNDLHSPAQVGSSNVWMETHFSASLTVSVILRILAANQLPPDALQLELTS